MDPRQAGAPTFFSSLGKSLLHTPYSMPHGSIIEPALLPVTAACDGSIFDNSKARGGQGGMRSFTAMTRELGIFCNKSSKEETSLDQSYWMGLSGGKGLGKPLPLSHQRLVPGVWTSAGFPFPNPSCQLGSLQKRRCRASPCPWPL